jgi:FkbM family methyltransferase
MPPSLTKPVETESDRIISAWDGTLFHVRMGDTIEEDIARRGAFELDVQQALFPWLRPGDIVIDAGANIGCHTCPMAIRVAPHGFVIAIEPVDRLADRLEANCRINGIANVTVIRSAVSSTVGKRRLAIPSTGDANQGNASLHRPPFPGGEELDLETTTIDEFVANLGLASLRLIKLDLEGDDYDALLGAAETLRRFRPVVAFEYHPDLWAVASRAFADADRLLGRQLGYRLSPLPSKDEVRTILAIPGPIA